MFDILRLHKSTRRIVLFAALLVVFNLVFFAPQWVTTLEYSAYFLKHEEYYDSWSVMTRALNYADDSGATKNQMYSRIFFAEKLKFQYPPTSLLFLDALKKSFASWQFILRIISWLSVLLTILFTILIFQHVRHGNLSSLIGEEDPGKNSNLILSILSLVIASLLFYPIVKSYNLGQIQTWLNAMFTVLFYCWLRNKQAAGGAILGVMSLIKPQYSLIALWGIVRKKRMFACSFFAVFVLFLLISCLRYGVNCHLEYLSVLNFLSRHGESFYANQSMNGLLNRLLFNGNIVEWKGSDFPEYNQYVYAGTLLFSFVLLATSFCLPLISKKRGSVIDFSLIAVSATMASPIAWEHHYGILFPIYVYLFSALLYKRSYKGIRSSIFYLLLASYLLVSSFIPALNSLAYNPKLNWMLSYLFYGAICLLVVLYVFLFKNESRSEKEAIPHAPVAHATTHENCNEGSVFSSSIPLFEPQRPPRPPSKKNSSRS